MSDEYDVEFFWDPVCPWAWLTSRWVGEVAAQRDLRVDWRFICLRLLNAAKDYERDFPAGYIAGHGSGQKLLRVAAAVRDAEGRDPIGDLYTQFGGDIHVRGRREDIVGAYEAGFPDYLRSVGVADAYVGAANDERWDAVLQAETDEALSRTGNDVGTPIISFRRDGEMHSFFGPVISSVPRGADALRLWDAVWEVATFPGVAELKRSLRERPQLADSLGPVATS
jgi:Mycothiol-dependent nitroreductase Rv2466c